jgi:hypothetical protein
MSWHVDRPLLESYATGTADPPHAYSVEAHLMECEVCRAALVSFADAPRLQRGWDDLEDRLDAPRPSLGESGLRRLGLDPALARLVAATPALTSSWLTGVAAALAFGVLAAHHGERGLLLFLALAALLPLAGVAAAFGPRLDPAYELSVAAPMSGVRLLLLRAVAVLVTTIALAAIAALALPGVGWSAAAWLLPSLALTGAGLALATYLAPAVALGAVGATWIAVVLAAGAGGGDALAVFGRPAQAAFAALAAGSLAVLGRRLDRLDLGRGL